MKPFLVTPQDAGRIPRWILPLLCAIYIVAGLFGRDPWRTDDAAGFGIAHTMSTGSTVDWLLPNIQGVMVGDDGPLPFWLAALGIRFANVLNQALAALGLPFGIAADGAVRSVAALGLAATFVLVWYAAYAFGRRPEIQPDDPMGVAANRVDFGRALADATLLATLAAFGLIARVHETTADAAQVTWIALYLYGLAHALDKPRSGGLLVGFAIGATVLTQGFALAGVLLASALVAMLAVRPYRLMAAWMLAAMVPAAMLSGLSWPALLGSFANDRKLFGVPLAIADPVRADLARFLDAWVAGNWQRLGGPTVDGLTYYLRNAPWFFWPLWPFVCWALWRWRGNRLEAPIAVPSILVLMCGTLALLDPVGSERSMLPLVLPMAFLAALSLPTISRSMVSLVDWFALAIFSVVGLVVWAYWLAALSGVPPRMALSASQALPGYDAKLSVLELLLGLAATAAWVRLVIWRTSRRRRPFWRPMALSSGGLVLAWFLLMTLWLPAANYRKSYREVASQAAPFLTDGRCVIGEGLDLGQRALFAYYANARFRRLTSLDGVQRSPDASACGWLLVSDREESPHDAAAIADRWDLIWRGQRPVNRGERLYLYARRSAENAPDSAEARRSTR